MFEKSLKDYVPRHLRLGVCCEPPKYEEFGESVQEIPVVDGSGHVVQSHLVRKKKPVDEVMQAYKLDHFRLSALIEAGVPLDVVNVNNSTSVTIDKLESICSRIDGADKFVQKVLEERKEKESWFTDRVFDSDSSENVDVES